MTDRLNTYIDQYAKTIPEPTAKIESIVAIAQNNRVTQSGVRPYAFYPVNDGLRRANRQEFMDKLVVPRIRDE